MRLRPALVALALFVGCDTNVIYMDDADPGATDVSFASEVLPIFQSRCGGSGCHAPGANSGVRLSNWGDVTGSVGNQYGTAVVIPGNAAGSPLVDKIEAGPLFGSRMPQGGSPLSNSEIAAIRTWIDEGAKDN